MEQDIQSSCITSCPVSQLLDTKSTDRKMTLLHFIALTVKEKYPDLANFWHELHFVEKAAAGEGACPCVQLRTIPGSCEEREHLGPFVSGSCCLSDTSKLSAGAMGRGHPSGSLLAGTRPVWPRSPGWLGAGRGRHSGSSLPAAQASPRDCRLFLCDVWEELRKTIKPLRHRDMLLLPHS